MHEQPHRNMHEPPPRRRARGCAQARAQAAAVQASTSRGRAQARGRGGSQTVPVTGCRGAALAPSPATPALLCWLLRPALLCCRGSSATRPLGDWRCATRSLEPASDAARHRWGEQEPANEQRSRDAGGDPDEHGPAAPIDHPRCRAPLPNQAELDFGTLSKVGDPT